MSGKRYELSISYRMTCNVKDPRNMGNRNSLTGTGFYWADPDNKTCNTEFDKMGITDEMTMEDIMAKIKTVTVPEGCEAIKVELTIYFPESTGCNGRHRENVEFQYFNDLK